MIRQTPALDAALAALAVPPVPEAPRVPTEAEARRAAQIAAWRRYSDAVTSGAGAPAIDAAAAAWAATYAA